MGFAGGNGGGNINTPTQTSIRIPQARLEIVKRSPSEQELIKQDVYILPLRVFYDNLGDNDWLNFSPKVFLFRYKKRMRKSRGLTHRPNPAIGDEVTPAGFVHTENGVDANNGINKITEFSANTLLPAQGNGTNRPFYKKHATTIRLNMSDWFRKMANDKFCPRGGATADTRFSEFFKFCYCIEKNGKLFFGDLSTETIKMRVEGLRDEKQKKVLTPILKLV